jgi:MOSC domain-containing protein YiiM
MSATIVSIAIKREKRQALDEVERAEINAQGVVGNIVQSDHRRVTLMSREHWAQVQTELSMDLPWTTRRANILVTGMDMAGSMGKTLTIGDVKLLVEGETVPCGLMDDYFEGLKLALAPDYRGGVCARVLNGGNIANGDTISVSE